MENTKNFQVEILELKSTGIEIKSLLLEGLNSILEMV